MPIPGTSMTLTPSGVSLTPAPIKLGTIKYVRFEIIEHSGGIPGVHFSPTPNPTSSATSCVRRLSAEIAFASGWSSPNAITKGATTATLGRSILVTSHRPVRQSVTYQLSLTASNVPVERRAAAQTRPKLHYPYSSIPSEDQRRRVRVSTPTQVRRLSAEDCTFHECVITLDEAVTVVTARFEDQTQTAATPGPRDSRARCA
jgi:hypothetical protein